MHAFLMSHGLLNTLLVGALVTPISPFIALAVMAYRRWRKSKAVLSRMGLQTWNRP